jgi:hypothetical protein
VIDFRVLENEQLDRLQKNESDSSMRGKTTPQTIRIYCGFKEQALSNVTFLSRIVSASGSQRGLAFIGRKLSCCALPCSYILIQVLHAQGIGAASKPPRYLA